MCGIAGIIHFGNKFNYGREDIEQMILSLSHRGPDNLGIYEDERVLLGHSRLSIIDLTSNANQPMLSDELVLIYNGEIYNYLDLKRELLSFGYNFNSNSDTEVILIGYKHWGVEIFKKLSGMFSICIYNKKTSEIILARDSFGVKPLFYYFTDEILIFASEIGAIKKVLKFVTLSININALDDIKSFLYVIGEKTIYNEIDRLKPSTHLKLNLLTKKREYTLFWSLDRNTNITDNYKESIFNLDYLLTNGINECLISDVPIGVFLSGGLDSSLLCAIASNSVKENLHTFSIGYTGKNSVFDESQYSNKVSSQFKTIHKHIDIDMYNVMNDIDHIFKSIDEPVADPSVFLNYIISQEASKNVKVCLTGLGADEIFGGYNRYQGFIFSQFLKKVPLPCRKILNEIINLLPQQRSNYITNYFRLLSKTFTSTYKSNNDTYFSMINYEINNKQSNFNFDYELANVNDLMNWDISNYMVNDLLFLTDKMSMLNSLEVRVPFLYKPLVQYAYSLNPILKTSLFSKKTILKKMAEKYLTKDVIYRRKQGFSAPIEIWLNSIGEQNYRNQIVNLLDSKLIEHDYINNLISGFYNRNEEYSIQLYTFFTISKWLS